MSRVRVTIDKLVLNGFDPLHSQALSEALRVELSRVLSDPASRIDGVLSQRTPIVRLGSLPLEPGLGGARKLGGGMARAIRRSLKA
jgi:hypothetical protein